jgi:pyridoxal phosphate enzyme (YggS family)
MATMSGTYAARLTETLPRVEDRMRDALTSAGRGEDEVRLVAVTKGHPLEAVEAALEAGLTDLGENRIAELEQKAEACGSKRVTWHMIGHVQSRKAPRVVGLADLLHSLDSRKLAGKLSRAAVDDGTLVEVLAQVNTSGEASKGGFDIDDGLDPILEIAELPGLKVRGLMTMAPFVDDEKVLGSAFERLRRLSERLREVSDDIGPELSMGMTNDLEIAIREGSTMIRIGTALFGERAGAA